MTTKLKSMLLILTAIISLFSFNIIVHASELPSGSGTENDPYIITSYDEFLLIKDFPDGHFKLANDINLPAEWTPIGVDSGFLYPDVTESDFTGVLDGNGYTISMEKTENYAGLFWQNFGAIKNICLIGELDGYFVGGMITGKNFGTIENCVTKGSIVGRLRPNYYPGNPYMGGIAQYNLRDGVIKNCYSLVNMEWPNTSLTNEYTWIIGGIAGENHAKIENCYYAGVLPPPAKNSGGIVAISSDTDGEYIEKHSISGCYYDYEIAGGKAWDGDGKFCTAKSTMAMKMKVTYKNWDFENIWAINENANNGYPYLRIEKSIAAEIPSQNYSYEIIDVSLKTTSGENLEQVPANSAFIVNLDFIKNKERNEKDYIFTAVYDKDGALLNLDYVYADFVENNTYSLGFYVPKQEKEIGKIKAFIWHSFDDMKNLCESKELNW